MNLTVSPIPCSGSPVAVAGRGKGRLNVERETERLVTLKRTGIVGQLCAVASDHGWDGGHFNLDGLGPVEYSVSFVLDSPGSNQMRLAALSWSLPCPGTPRRYISSAFFAACSIRVCFPLLRRLYRRKELAAPFRCMLLSDRVRSGTASADRPAHALTVPVSSQSSGESARARWFVCALDSPVSRYGRLSAWCLAGHLLRTSR